MLDRLACWYQRNEEALAFAVAVPFAVVVVGVCVLGTIL